MEVPSQYSDFFKEKKRIYFVFAALIILIVGAIGWWRVYIYPYEATDDANIDGVEIAVSSEIAGRIVQLFVDEGSNVKRGDLLFVLDDQLLQAQREKAEAGVANAGDQVAYQQVKVELARQDYLRAKREYEGGVISSEEMDHAEKAFEAEKAEFQALLSAVAVQEASLKYIQTQISKTSVYASCEGVIGKRWHFPGDVVREGQTVFTLFDLSNIWVTANLEETKVGLVHFNDPVLISIDAYPHLDFTGNVEVIGAGAASQFSLIPPNNAAGNFTKVTQRIPVRISLKAPYSADALYLRPGMSAEIKIKTK